MENKLFTRVSIERNELIVIGQTDNKNEWWVNYTKCPSVPMFNKGNTTWHSATVGIGKSMIFAYDNSKEEVGDVEYYDISINPYKPTTVYKKPY